jgi:hypothetical protein
MTKPHNVALQGARCLFLREGIEAESRFARQIEAVTDLKAVRWPRALGAAVWAGYSKVVLVCEAHFDITLEWRAA